MARQGIATLEDPEAFLGFGGDPMIPAGAPSVSDRAADMIRLMESGLPTGRPFSALVGDKDTLRITKNPYEILEDRQRQAGDLAVGATLGLTSDLAGLPADLLVLAFSDAPKFAAALATGTPFAEMPTNVADEGLRALRNVLGSDAIAGYLGVTEEALQRPGIESGRILSSIVDPAVLALMLRPLIRRFRPGVAGPRSTDELAAAAASDAAARAGEDIFGPGEDPMDVFGGRAGPQSPPDAPRAPEDGPPEQGPIPAAALPGGDDARALARQAEAVRADRLRGTASESVANVFEDSLNSRLGTDTESDIDYIMQSIMESPDASAARVVADELGISPEDVSADALFLIRGRNMGNFVRAPSVSRTLRLSDPNRPLEIRPGESPLEALAQDQARRGLIDSVDGEFTFDSSMTQETIDALNGPNSININPLIVPPDQNPLDGSVYSYAPGHTVETFRAIGRPYDGTTDYMFEEDMYDLTGRRIPAGSRVSWPEEFRDQFFEFFTSSPPRTESPSIVSDTPQEGFTGTVDLPDADPDTGSQLMSTTSLSQPFPQVIDRSEVSESMDQVPVISAPRQGEVASYSPLRQLIAALPEDRALSKDEILRAIDPNAGSQEYRNSVQRDVQGSQFDEWIKTHVSDDGITRDELLSKYDQYAPQIRVINVLESDLGGGSNLFPNDNQLPNSGSQESVDDDFIMPANNGESLRGHIYLTNPTGATIKYRRSDGQIGDWALEASDVEDVNDHQMTVTGRRRTKPLGKDGVLGYFGHVRYVVIEDAAGRKMMLVQEIQSNHTVTQARGDDVAFLTPKEQENVQYLIDNPDVLKDFELIDDIDDKTQTFDIATTGNPVTIEQVEAKYGGMGKLVADQMLDNLPDSTLLTVFGSRAGGGRQRGMYRRDLLKESFSNMPPERVSKFNTLMENRFKEFLAPDGSVLSLDEIANKLDRTSDTDDKLRSRAGFVRDVVERYQNTKARNPNTTITPHDYLMGRNPIDFDIYLSGDRTFFGDIGKNELEDNFRVGNTRTSTYAAELDEYITSVSLARAKDRMDTAVAPEGMSAERFEELKKSASTMSKTLSRNSNAVGEYRTMSPFAQTRHFEEFTPKLILQEARKAGLDGVIFPNYRDMKDVRGRPQLITVKNIYEKGVKKGLSQMGVNVVNLDRIDAVDFTDGSLKSLPHKYTGNAHRSARAVYFAGENDSVTSPTKVLRRAKGGPVDLRPKKLVHSGIGAMARQVM